ncbi:arf-GAP domain and FG repeat-containing protein 2 [Carica papaya]|uniref:arf-GAP domain and FG repeat-containing protein 2 n=1 Tax=Carica papaya TaxID=3649 RepID=UPI000B8CB4F4|nr:arf-GAP domain and FG repeat-containing protein 2 [Carica papaya]
MANRLKEDEKNERIIRGLLKLPDNRRCINCNSLGPQYVCTNFWTFVCTTCSGIHREFTHRVKSISMAKFTSQEVSSLQEGGNQRAKEIYFKEWDPQRQSFPDSSNVERLRDFIKHVYVDRRYSGEKNYDRPPRVKMGDKEEIYENRNQGGSRSPPYEETYERRYSDRSSSGGRSPVYEPDSRQYGDYRRSPARPEIINDWRRDDRFGNGRKFEDHGDGESKLEGRSPERVKDMESSSPPVVRPVREILGENIVPLRISEPPKANGGRAVDSSVHTQRTASSGSLGSTNENPPEVKLESTRSLIDFDSDPEPLPAAVVTQAQQTAPAQSTVPSTSTANDNNWASFDFAPDTRVLQAPANAYPLDSVLSQLSAPATVPGHATGLSSGAGGPIASSPGNVNLLSIGDPPSVPMGHTPMLPFGAGAPASPQVSSFSTFPSCGPLSSAQGLTPVSTVSGVNSFVKVTDPSQWSSTQHQQPSLFPAGGGQFTSQQFRPPLGGPSGNQPWNMSNVSNIQGPLSTTAAQVPQAISKTPQPQEMTSSGTQPSPEEAKLTGRKELPEDLFTATYPSYPAIVPGWQTGPPRGMGFRMPYNTVMPLQTFSQPSKSTNPFDFSGEQPQHAQTPPHTQMFPSMAPLQSALPNVSPPSGFSHTSNVGNTLPAWMPPQTLLYASGMPAQAPNVASAMPPRYMEPQLSSNMPPSRQQVGSVRGEGASFGFVNMDQQLASRFPAPAAPRPFSSVGGNPFG